MPRRRDKPGYEPWPSCGFALGDGTECQSVSAARDGGPCESHAAAADATPVVRGSVRRRLADDLDAGYEKLRAAVFDALDADRPIPVSCPGCKKRFQVRAPDHGARLKAVDVAISQGFGRPTDAAKVLEADRAGLVMVDDPIDFSKLTDQELRLMAAGYE